MMKRVMYLFIASVLIFAACKPQSKYVLCDNGKVEKNGDCECPAGYTGDNCEVLQLQNLLGKYKGTLTQNDTIIFNNNIVSIDTMTPSALMNVDTLVAVSIHANNMTRSYGCSVVDSNNFVFKKPTGEIIVTGTVKNNILQLTHYISGEGKPHDGTYTFIGTKQ